MEHPTQHLPFWYNEICGTAQWQHPVDDFVKTTIKLQRLPNGQMMQPPRRSTPAPRRRHIAHEQPAA